MFRKKINLGAACLAFLIIGILAFFLGYMMDNYFNGQNVNQTFYATITEIDEEILVADGLEVNDINFRGLFSLSVTQVDKYEWRYETIEANQLEVGDNISITFRGDILESSPAQLQDVTRIQVLDDQL